MKGGVIPGLVVLCLLAACAGGGRFASGGGPAVVSFGAYGPLGYRHGSQDWSAVAVEYTRRSQQEPDSIVAWRRLGLAQYRLGDYAAAERSLARVVELRPGDWFGCAYLGLTRVAMGQRELGFDTVRQTVVEDEYFVKREMECSADHVQGKELPDQESAALLEEYLLTIIARQQVRERCNRISRENGNDCFMGGACPPMLTDPNGVVFP